MVLLQQAGVAKVGLMSQPVQEHEALSRWKVSATRRARSLWRCSFICVRRGLLFVGLLWTQPTRPIRLPGPVIEVDLVGITRGAEAAVAASRPQTARRRNRNPSRESRRSRNRTAAQPKRNDQIEREKVAEIAQQKAEEAKRAQEERQRQEQVLLEQQQREERDRQKQLEDIKRQREAADKNVKLEREKLAQMEDLQKKQAGEAVSQPVPERRPGQNRHRRPGRQPGKPSISLRFRMP